MRKAELLRVAKPILFNTDMVRAILNGRKTATRRCVKPRLDACPSCMYMNVDYIYDTNAQNIYCARCGEPFNPTIKSPYQSGDILYVRETYCPNYFDFTTQYGNRHGYKADYDKAILSSCIPKPKWKPSIHMPKEAARIFLKVTDIRVERLQDMETVDDRNYVSEGAKDKHDFIHIWDATVKNKENYGWYANPWVWAIEFERIFPDDLMKGQGKMVDKWLKWENGKEWREIQCPMLDDETVMTYYPEGVPCYYSYTAPFVCNGNIYCYRYDHDEGRWDEDTLFCMGEYIGGTVVKFGEL